jgi:hypothetical protein
MKSFTIIFIVCIGASSVSANDGISSEMGHFFGGTVMAGGVTAIVDSYYPEYKEDRGVIGFGISSALIVVEQGIEYALHGDAKGQLLDTVSHIAGSSLGAYVTDQFLLTPIISDSKTEGTFVGLNLQHSF